MSPIVQIFKGTSGCHQQESCRADIELRMGIVHLPEQIQPVAPIHTVPATVILARSAGAVFVPARLHVPLRAVTSRSLAHELAHGPYDLRVHVCLRVALGRQSPRGYAQRVIAAFHDVQLVRRGHAFAHRG